MKLRHLWQYHVLTPVLLEIPPPGQPKPRVQRKNSSQPVFPNVSPTRPLSKHTFDIIITPLTLKINDTSSIVYCRLSASIIALILSPSTSAIDYTSQPELIAPPQALHLLVGALPTIPPTTPSPKATLEDFAISIANIHCNRVSLITAARVNEQDRIRTMPSRLETPVLTVDVGLIHKVDTRNVENLFSMWSGQCNEYLFSRPY
jgi:hypothetical protein